MPLALAGARLRGHADFEGIPQQSALPTFELGRKLAGIAAVGRGRMYVMRLAADFVTMSRRQWADRERIEAWQSQRLHEVVAHAQATVPLYRERLAAVGIDARGVRTLADLAALPILTRAELSDTPLERRVTSLVDVAKLRVGRTSGSTGRPIAIPRDPVSRRINKIQFVRALAAARYRLGDSMLLLTRPPNGGGNSRWLRWHHAGRDSPPEQHLMAWRETRPRFVYGFVTSMRRLAQLLIDEPEPRHRVRAVFTSGEVLDRATRALLERAFGGPVFDIYGAAEFGTIGWECEHHDGLHVDDDLVLTELVPVHGSDTAQLVLTSLKNCIMPLIRYAIGDFAVPAPRSRCLCRRSFHRIGRVEGRVMDSVRRPDGALLAPFLLTEAVEGIPGLVRYQIVQEALDRFTIRAEGHPADTARAEAQVAEAIRRAVGAPVEVGVRWAESLDPPPGRKFHVIESRVPCVD